MAVKIVELRPTADVSLGHATHPSTLTQGWEILSGKTTDSYIYGPGTSEFSIPCSLPPQTITRVVLDILANPGQSVSSHAIEKAAVYGIDAAGTKTEILSTQIWDGSGAGNDLWLTFTNQVEAAGLSALTGMDGLSSFQVELVTESDVYIAAVWLKITYGSAKFYIKENGEWVEHSGVIYLKGAERWSAVNPARFTNGSLYLIANGENGSTPAILGKAILGKTILGG